MDKKQGKLSEGIREAARRAVSEAVITQNGLARAAGMDKSSFSRFLSGKRWLSLENLDGLAAVLNLRVVDASKAPRRTKKAR